MATSTRIRGKGLTLKLGGVDYAVDATSVTLVSEDSADDPTFAEAAAGSARDWKFEIEAIQSTDSASFWSYLWDNAGDTGIAYIFAPHGNVSASSSQPHFTGTVTVPNKPDVGGKANETFTFSFTLECEQEPTIDRTP